MKRLFFLVCVILALVCAVNAATVFDFSDINEIKKWDHKVNGMVEDSATGRMPQMTDDDGTVFMRAVTDTATNPLYIRSLAESEQVDIDTNKYFVARYRLNYSQNNYIYFGTDYLTANPALQYAWFEGMLTQMSYTSNDTWDVIISDMPTYLAGYSSILKGEDKSSANPNVSGKFEWRGKLTKIYVQPDSAPAGQKADWEFMAFVKDEEEAYKLLSERAAAIASKGISVNSAADDTALTAAVKAVLEGFAARYKLTVSDVALANIQNATLANDGSATVSYKLNGKTYSFSYSAPVTITMIGANITGVPEGDVKSGSTISLTAAVEDFTPTSYSWYINTTDSVDGATQLAGSAATLDFVVTVPKTYYFFVTATDGTSTVKSDFVPVTVTAEPLIWRFNNSQASAEWTNYTDVSSSIVDGVRHTPYHATRKVDGHHFAPSSAEPIYLEAYPYVKVKFRYSGSYSHAQFYFPNSVTSANIYYQPTFTPVANAWNTLAVDFLTAASSYPMSGKDGTAPYMGKLTTFNFWIWNSAGAGSSDIEYIAFFPASAEGKAAWQDFDSQSPSTQGSSDAYMPDYKTVADIFTAAKTLLASPDTSVTSASLAKTKIENAVNASKGTAELHKITIGDATATENGFECPVTIEMGNYRTRTIITQKLSVTNVLPKPIVWKFNNPEFVGMWTEGGNVTKTFGASGTESYMSIDSKHTDKDSNVVTWSEIPEANRFDLEKYPYVAIRYRSTHNGAMQFYYSTTTTANSASTAQYRHLTMTNTVNDWTTLIANISTTQGGGAWNGTIDYLHLINMRYAAAKKDIDFDYIAFFATEAQAKAYAGEVEGDSAKTAAALALIDEDKFGAVYEGVNDADSAKAKLEELISSLELPEGVRTHVVTSGYTATEPSLEDGMVGKYGYTIYFLHGPAGSSAVSVYNGQLPLQPKPVITQLGAQIRTSAPQGIRFGTRLDKSFMADADIKNVSYGTVVAPADYIAKGSQLTLETAGAADVKAVNIFSQTDDEIIYTAVVHNIPEKEENRKIAARAYVKFTMNNKEYTVYSDSTKLRSVSDLEALTQEGYDEQVADVLGVKSYDNAIWMTPIWEGTTMYHELFWPVMPDGANEGDDLVIDLLYPITCVLTVKDGTNTVDYAEGKDYYVNDNGQLVIPATSAIKPMKFNEYIMDNGNYKITNTDEKYASLTAPYLNKYLYFIDRADIQKYHQYSITYRHAEGWTDDTSNPDKNYDANVLGGIREKLENKQSVNIAFIGDSKTAGGNNTGNFGVAPNTPKWSVMMVDRLKTLYGYNDIGIINRAVGGTGSYWGAHGEGDSSAKNTYELFKNDDFDLFIIAYGGNDYTVPRADYKANISSIIDQALEINPDSDILLIPSAFSNPMWQSVANHEFHEAVLEEIAAEYAQEGVSIDCAKLRSVMDYIMTKKPYRDVSGNNLNHQNDLHARIIAQVALAYITDKN